MILRPLTPPAALRALKKACAPYPGPEKASVPTGLVIESIIPTLMVSAVTPSTDGPAPALAALLNALLGRRVPHPATLPAAATATTAAASGAKAARQSLITPWHFPAYRVVTRAGSEWTANGAQETMSGRAAAAVRRGVGVGCAGRRAHGHVR